MQLICKNDQLINHFSGNNSLLDGKIKKIEIFSEESSACIKVDVDMRRSSDYKKVQLIFNGCKTYCFLYSDDYYFYNIEIIKLFKCDDGFYYISFDPVDEAKVISDEDTDFILCREISAYSD